MKLVILKPKFISEYRASDCQFCEKHDRPYLLLCLQGISYLIPLSRQKPKEDRRCFYTISPQSYILFHKCFIVYDDSRVILRNYTLLPHERYISYELNNNKNLIENKFDTYLKKMHPRAYSLNESICRKLQNK